MPRQNYIWFDPVTGVVQGRISSGSPGRIRIKGAKILAVPKKVNTLGFAFFVDAQGKVRRGPPRTPPGNPNVPPRRGGFRDGRGPRQGPS